MTLTAASWTLRALYLSISLLSSAAAGELALLNLCKPRQSRISFENVELRTVPLFKNGNESLLENLFQFQERSNTSGCLEDNPVDLSKIQFTSHGYLGIKVETRVENETQTTFVWYAPTEYCVEVSSEKRLKAVRLIKCVPSKAPLMISKCCPPGYAVDHQKWESKNPKYCVPSNVTWTPKLYDHESFDGDRCVRPTSEEKWPEMRFYTQELLSDIYDLGPKRPLAGIDGRFGYYRYRWRLLNNGSFAELYPSTSRWYPHGTWEVEHVVCADMLINIAGIGNPESVEFYVKESGAPRTANAVNGTQNATECVIKDSATITYIVCYFLSSPFLILTIAAFVLTRKSQTVYGWTMLSHLVTFLLMNIALGISLWMSSCVQAGAAPATCTAVGIAVNFLFLSLYVWLTCLNFDLWWTFRELRSVSNNTSFARYYMYAAVSIGLPLIFTMTGYIFDVIYGEYGYDSDCQIVLPEFGLTKCFLATEAEGPYLYYPLLVLLFLNTVFFLLTASKIYGVRASTKLVRKPTEGIDKDAVLLFGKLFIVMGTSCVFEFISWFAQPDGEQHQNLVFVAIDFLNYLGRSIVIFLIFGCKKQVRVEARRVLVQWGVLVGGSGSSPTSSGGTQVSTVGGSTIGGPMEASSSGGAMKMRNLQGRANIK